ncbi:MAG: carbamoyl-phosphate synthase large subunit [Candidatus Hydrogenedentes bacterium]|nr:carbamoyl-phosphate synthase large subunit [Candidatus Hydrogenedentota bacterium]
MPKRTDIKTVMIIGSGPIVIGQACEFDYSGTQACKALREEGYRVVLVNSNPATIMTDPGMADRTYIEPLVHDVLAKVIERERPDALLPTLGGQTGLNLAVELYKSGTLDKYGVEMIGAQFEAINKAEDRDEFKLAMERIGLEVPASGYVKSLDEALEIVETTGYPSIIRPSFTLGGHGGSIAYNREEFESLIKWGLDASPVHEVLVETSVIGWKEFELEVMRDCCDNVVIICSIENFDPMGVHTGDSITVAPAQTLTDKEYQIMRDAAIDIIREIGVDTGGSNIQFAVHPDTGRMVVIEMNPRVSRSSALASKATGFPIAKIAAKLAVGYRLDELPNDITRETTSCFEPTIDYCVVKIPRWAFEKFPGAEPNLTVQMKSVGEAMSIGRTFKESLQKGLRSLEIDRYGLGADGRGDRTDLSPSEIISELRVPRPDRIFLIRDAVLAGLDVDTIFDATKIDPWFLRNMVEIINDEKQLRDAKPEKGQPVSRDIMLRAKRNGFSDRQLAHLWDMDEIDVRTMRLDANVSVTFKLVDTCAAEFEAFTPYYYSTYSDESEVRDSDKRKIMILGGGPNRIGQGIEFDYCCVHASFALHEDGFETIMVNSNPETVSTDYDTSDRLYFEPLTLEDVLNIVDREKPHGVIVQFGGQTPLKLAVPLEKAGVPILGTSPDSIDRAEDRRRFQEVVDKLELNQPPNGTAVDFDGALDIAHRIGYPVLVRPSYVLGGRAMEIVYSDEALEQYMRSAVQVSSERPVLIDKFLEDAVEIDVDAISDGSMVVVGGIMEHIERAGVHSGDSACVLPPESIPADVIDTIRKQTHALARELNVIGLLNIQYAVQRGKVYVLEVNPRASRTVPFVSKSIGRPLAKLAARVMAGKSLEELGFTSEVKMQHVSVKEAVLPFIRFPGVDILLSPEMKSTGEVMGVDTTFGMAYAKSQAGAGSALPTAGAVFISVNDHDKPQAVEIAHRLHALGFKLMATAGTAAHLAKSGIEVEPVYKVKEGRPNVVDRIKNGDVDLIVNTPLGSQSEFDERSIRRTAIENGVPCITTMAGARAAVEAVGALRTDQFSVRSLQEYHGTAK